MPQGTGRHGKELFTQMSAVPERGRDPVQASRSDSLKQPCKERDDTGGLRLAGVARLLGASADKGVPARRKLRMVWPQLTSHYFRI